MALVLAPTRVATPWPAGAQLSACLLIRLVLRLKMSEAVRVSKVASGGGRSGCSVLEIQQSSWRPRVLLGADLLRLAFCFELLSNGDFYERLWTPPLTDVSAEAKTSA